MALIKRELQAGSLPQNSDKKLLFLQNDLVLLALLRKSLIMNGAGKGKRTDLILLTLYALDFTILMLARGALAFSKKGGLLRARGFALAVRPTEHRLPSLKILFHGQNQSVAT